MKHLKVLSAEKPLKAEEVAWIQLKDLIGPNIPKVGPVTPRGNLSQEQARWLTAQWDNWLQK